MSEKYSFFFSYTRADHEICKRDNPAIGSSHNWLDVFFDQLARVVSGKIGADVGNVAFRDTKRIELCEIWPETLTASLQAASTLVAVVTPRFLKSENCGREIQFFMDRYEDLKRNGGVCPHPIIPIYWENTIDCTRDMPDAIKPFFSAIQFKTEDFPSNYPTTGLRQIFSSGQPVVMERICEAIAEHIVGFHTGHDLPPHINPRPFDQLPSMFSLPQAGTQCLCEPTVSSGTDTAQVVYVVGSKDEVSAVGVSDVSAYETRPEEWRPFSDAAGATIESATEEGLRKLGGIGCCNWGWPENLVDKIAEAQQKCSPVLLVLDRASLAVERIRTAMDVYDGRNFHNAGLVTAGGVATDDEVKQVLQHKFSMYPQTHLWNIPVGRTTFVDNVADIVGHLRRKLISMQSMQNPGLQASSVPSLRGPCGN